MRAKYDKKNKSFIGRLWRWHINFCPGWKKYFKSLSDEEKEEAKTIYTNLAVNYPNEAAAQLAKYQLKRSN